MLESKIKEAKLQAEEASSSTIILASKFSPSSPSMEAPPPPLSAAAAAAAAAPPAAAVYPDSLDSSPRSRHTDSWDTEPPLPPQKLRLMCSYGGHIVPRPHDKSLCYIGGDTRIIVIDRHTSLSDLRLRLSKTLLNNQSFSLKYQLPTEDLDSLISVTTEEDLENMVEEYDRLSNAGGGAMKPGRLRLFLFPQSSANIEQLLVETASTKSDDWFFNALNGKSSTLSAAASDRGFSESSSVNCLLGLDDESVGKATAAGKDAEAQIEGPKAGGIGNNATNQDVHSVPDSPMLETTSSFGSTSSSPSVANLPPIRVHVDEIQKMGALGIEDQFQQMAVGVAANVNFGATPKTEEVGGFTAAGVAAGTMVSGVPVMVGGGDQPNRVISDDERSDPGGYRRVQHVQPQVQSQMQQIPQPQFQQKQTGGFELASPDSVSSEGSIKNPLSRQRQAMYQEQFIQIQSGNNMVVSNPADLKSGDQNANKIQMQQQHVQESGYVISGQYDHNQPQMHHPQQFVHSGNQYIPAGAIPYTSYYSVYPSQQQHHPHQPMPDQQQQHQQYPVYFVPARQTQAYNIPVQQQQQTYSEMAANVPSSRSQTPSAAAVASHVAYSQQVNAPSNKPEMAAGVYRTAAGATTHMVQVPSSQQPQAQYVGFTQIHHPSQMMAPTSAANSAYTYEFTDPTQGQMYYTQAMPPQFSAQYQTMASAPQGISSDASSENMKQQVRTMQQQ